MNKKQTVYFDESGFTGNNLLNNDQPAFVYAGVAIDPDHASYIHSELTSRVRLQGNELKGKNLVSQTRGRKAISWLLNECNDYTCIAVSNKKYALAGKFYEYIFEPVLAPQNSLFYAVDFHKFIATLMYVLFESKDTYAEDILTDFENLMKTQDVVLLESLLSPIDKGVQLADPLGQVLTFTVCHRERIADEIKNMGDIDGIHKWALELTTTSLFWILSFWSEQFQCLDVVCDHSKPLISEKALYDVMIGRKDKIYMKLGSRPEVALTFNLAGPVSLVDSQQTPGVQIADVISSSIAYAFKNPDDSLSEEWLSLADKMAHGPCILPETEAVDLQQKQPFINGLILHELVDRTLKGKSLFTDMDKFILASEDAYNHFSLEQK